MTHDVFAEFGGEEKSPEVWLFVKSGRGNIQYLTQEGLDDKWGVTQVKSHQSFFQKTQRDENPFFSPKCNAKSVTQKLN